MSTFSTFDQYKEQGGKLTEAQYSASVGRAYAEIISQTNGMANNVVGMEDKLASCECELVDAVFSFDQAPKGVSSVSNDGYAVVYGGRNSNDGLSGEADTYRAICVRYLQTPVNLMCRWL